MKTDNFARNLERLMEENGDSPVDLAEKLHTATMHIGLYTGYKVSAIWLRQLVQNHDNTPSVPLLEAIAEIYGIEVWELLAPPQPTYKKLFWRIFWRPWFLQPISGLRER